MRLISILTLLLLPSLAWSQILVKPGDDVQAACDRAVEKPSAIQPVHLLSGLHRTKKPVVSLCPIRGIGYARLHYTGSTTDEFVLTVRGTSGWTIAPATQNLTIACNKKAAGLLVDDAHGVRVGDIVVFGSRGYGVHTIKGWNVHLKNLRVCYAQGRAFDLQAFGASTAIGLDVVSVKGKGPILYCRSQGLIQQLNIERCSSTENPLILLEEFRLGKLDGFWGEQNEAAVMIECRKTFGATIERLSMWQNFKQPGKVAISLVNCEAVEVGAMECGNFSDALLQIGPECRKILYDRRRIVDYYRGWPEGSSKYLVQPRRLVEYIGRKRP